MATNTGNTGITAKHPEYMRLSPLWKDIRAVLFGKSEVVKLKLPVPDYTDKNKDKRIVVYLSRGQLLNATARTHDSLTGMIWSNDPEGIDTIPASMDYVNDYLRKNVQKIVDDVVSIGRYGVLLDSDSEGVHSAADIANGVGVPVWIMYKAEQITYWRDNEVRLSEVYEVLADDGINYEEKRQVRRLILIDGVYHNQVWREDVIYSDTIPSTNAGALNYIPFQYFGSDDNSKEATKPPLYDLTETNLGHFMLDCDNRDNLHYHGQGLTNIFIKDTAAFIEDNPNGLNVGAKGVNQFGNEDRVEILQIEATGAIASEMLRDQERMIMIGAQLVQDTSGNQTLGAKRMEFGSSISTLKRIAINVSEGVTWLLNKQAEMTGQSADISYKLNTKFITDELTPELLLAHMQLVQMGSLPKSTLNESARQAGLTKLTDAEIKKELNDQSFVVAGTDKDTATNLAAGEV